MGTSVRNFEEITMTDSDNVCVMLHKIDDLRIDPCPVPEPDEHEVLLKMDSVGICGSDVHYWKSGHIGEFVVKEPLILGHEGAGIVVKCGSKVTHLQPGDRVAVEPQTTCFRCDKCKTGRYNLCPDVTFCATPPHDGHLRHYYTHQASFCFKLPDNMSLEEGALCEPAAVGVHACRRGQVELGKTVLVCGSGPIGLINMMTAKAFGATEVVVTDISASRLEVAKSLGADAVYQVKRGMSAEETANDIIATAFKDGRRPDVTIECSGAESSIMTAVYVTMPGGRVVLVGIGPTEVKVPTVIASTREVDIVGVFRYVNCYPAAISMISSGKINVKPLVTNRFHINDSLDAFEASRTARNGAIKVMIKCQKDWTEDKQL